MAMYNFTAVKYDLIPRYSVQTAPFC